jgi:hypothetical protein
LSIVWGSSWSATSFSTAPFSSLLTAADLTDAADFADTADLTDAADFTVAAGATDAAGAAGVAAAGAAADAAAGAAAGATFDDPETSSFTFGPPFSRGSEAAAGAWNFNLSE